MLLFIDFEKAFVSLEWKFLFEAIDAMNFGPMFQNWIHVFYSTTPAAYLIMVLLRISSPFIEESGKGVPYQGCYLSWLLKRWPNPSGRIITYVA